jgi:hypothetical protein
VANGLWLDPYLVDSQNLQWGNPSPPVPSKVELYTNNHTPVNADTIAAFTLDGTTATTVDYSTLTFALDAVNHRSVASQSINFVFDAGQAGNVYYGIVLMDSGGTIAMWAVLLDAPYTVPVGGGVLTVQLQWVWADCADAP